MPEGSATFHLLSSCGHDPQRELCALNSLLTAQGGVKWDQSCHGRITVTGTVRPPLPQPWEGHRPRFASTTSGMLGTPRPLGRAGETT